MPSRLAAAAALSLACGTAHAADLLPQGSVAVPSAALQYGQIYLSDRAGPAAVLLKALTEAANAPRQSCPVPEAPEPHHAKAESEPPK